MKIGLVVKKNRADFSPRLRETIAWLRERHCQILVEPTAVEEHDLGDVCSAPVSRLAAEADVIVVFGGDGTMLWVVREVGGNGTPILGVNLGTLGFLTSVKLEELDRALEKTLQRDCVLDRRNLLKTEVRRSNGSSETYHALNDVVINKGALARIISLNAYIGEDFISRFLADGLIISTPTGSTAYSLAAGGPILFPSLQALIVTPICPHTLTNRPIVVPSDQSIRVELSDGEDVMLTIDGQTGIVLGIGDEIVCTQSEYHVNLIQPGHKSFFDVLREKLKWGER